ncbi:MAG: hypothetical protein QOK16_1138 [Solirubrobacteraceae bacterium]|jgi:nucleoid-associated protein YgaU|nr:hypothetical protein [Solirubrobacteraceae bacterium]
MDSVSRPLLIALGGMVVLLAVWLVALKPKPVAVDKTPLAPTQAIPKAKAAAAVSDAANAKLQAATGEAAPAPAASAAAPAPAAPAAPAKPVKPAKPATDSGRRLDGSILRDIGKGRIVVVLFWNAQGADDIATRGALRELDRHHGRVAIHVVPIARVGRYPAITQGVTIAQSPTTLVIGRKRHTRVITGLSEPRELSQVVDDALAGR